MAAVDTIAQDDAAKALTVTASITTPYLAGYDPSRLVKWRDALGAMQAGVASARLCLGGDSTEAGYLSASPSGNTNAAAYAVSRILANMLTRMGYYANDGLMTPRGMTTTGGVSTFDSRIAFTGSSWAITASSGLEPYTFTNNSSTTDAVTFTWSGTAVDVYSRGSSATSGVFDVTIDGTDKGNITQTRATAGMYKNSYTGLSSGSHVVTIKRVSGSVFLEGVDIYDPTKVGFEILNFASSGATTGNYAVSSQPYQTLYAPAALGCSLVLQKLGINDAKTAAPTATATVQAAWDAMLPQWLTTSSVVLEGFTPLDLTNSSQALQNTYRGIVKAKATQYGVPYLGLDEMFGNTNAAMQAAGEGVNDGYHLTYIANGFIAQNLLPIALGFR